MKATTKRNAIVIVPLAAVAFMTSIACAADPSQPGDDGKAMKPPQRAGPMRKERLEGRVPGRLGSSEQIEQNQLAGLVDDLRNHGETQRP
jgi:hypothetical protein